MHEVLVRVRVHVLVHVRVPCGRTTVASITKNHHASSTSDGLMPAKIGSKGGVSQCVFPAPLLFAQHERTKNSISAIVERRDEDSSTLSMLQGRLIKRARLINMDGDQRWDARDFTFNPSTAMLTWSRPEAARVEILCTGHQQRQNRRHDKASLLARR